MLVCSIEGCDRVVFERGWCGRHYYRWRTYGDPMISRRYRSDTGVCTVEGCDRKHLSRGYCSRHYQQWQRDGEAEKRRPGDGLKVWSRGDPEPVPPISYWGVHDRLSASRGPARNYQCFACGAAADEWAYDREDASEVIGTAGRGRLFVFSRDLAHYVPLCRSCHRRLDAGDPLSWTGLGR